MYTARTLLHVRAQNDTWWASSVFFWMNKKNLTFSIYGRWWLHNMRMEEKRHLNKCNKKIDRRSWGMKKKFLRFSRLLLLYTFLFSAVSAVWYEINFYFGHVFFYFCSLLADEYTQIVSVRSKFANEIQQKEDRKNCKMSR